MIWSPEPARLGVIWERLVKGRNHPTSQQFKGDGNNFPKTGWVNGSIEGELFEFLKSVLGKKGQQWRWAWAWDGPALKMAMPEWPWHSATFSQPSWADLAFLKCFPSRINAPRLFYLLLWLHGMWGWRDGSHSPLYMRQDPEVIGVTSVSFSFFFFNIWGVNNSICLVVCQQSNLITAGPTLMVAYLFIYISYFLIWFVIFLTSRSCPKLFYISGASY